MGRRWCRFKLNILTGGGSFFLGTISCSLNGSFTPEQCKGSREQVIKSYLENKRGFFVLWGYEKKKKHAESDAVLLFRYLLPLKRRLRR